MTNGEETTIRNVIQALKAGRDGSRPSCSPEITAALTTYAMRVWLDTWIIGGLECLLPESRDVDLAVRLTKR